MEAKKYKIATYKYKKFFFNQEKELYLNQNQINKNIFFCGACGTGKTNAHLNLAIDKINEGEPLLFLSCGGDGSTYLTMYEQSILANRAKDFIFINFENDYSKLGVDRLLKKNKIIIMFVSYDSQLEVINYLFENR